MAKTKSKRVLGATLVFACGTPVFVAPLQANARSVHSSDAKQTSQAAEKKTKLALKFKRKLESSNRGERVQIQNNKLKNAYQAPVSSGVGKKPCTDATPLTCVANPFTKTEGCTAYCPGAPFPKP